MLITNKSILKNYKASNCLWVGIPSIEVTKGGRTFLGFYSGGTTEEIGNYIMFIKSDDGENFSEPIAVCFEEGYRCFDPCLWIDPLGRLWLIWARSPEDAVYASICENPDADEPVFGEEFCIGNEVMMNKPIVLSNGEWMFPIAVWLNNVKYPVASLPDDQIGSFAYVTCDQGKTFKKLGAADVKNRYCDEHMFVEMPDGRVRCYVRTFTGIGAADSYDQGLHWGESFDTGITGPSSRFHIRRLESGRILFVYHYDTDQRANLTAMLSEDDGATFPYRLVVDERQAVSYPDAAIDSNGMINITYDRSRGCSRSRLEDALICPREILAARISEEDIIKGSLVNEKSFLKNIAFKHTDYEGAVKNPYNEEKRFTSLEYAKYLSDTNDNPEAVIEKIMDVYKANFSNIHNPEAKKLDNLINEYREKNDVSILAEIITLIRDAETKATQDEKKLVDRIYGYITQNPDKISSPEDVANEFDFSTSYINYIFNKKTGTSIMELKEHIKSGR